MPLLWIDHEEWVRAQWLQGEIFKSCLRIEAQLKTIIKKGTQIMTDLTEITTEVQENSDAIDSAVILLGKLKEMIDAAGTDPVKLKELSDMLDANSKRLAEAVVANTPAE